MRSISFVLASCLTLVLHSSLAAAEEPEVYEIRPLTADQREKYKLPDSFFKKGILVEDILIATSDRVSDYACREAAYQFEKIMKSIREDIAARIRQKGVLCILVGHDELTSEIPQFATEKTGDELDFYNWRQRGFLTWKSGTPTVLFAEEDVLEYEGGMQKESILIHEFGHVVQGVGFDKELQERVTAAFKNAKAEGLWNDGCAAQRFRRVKSEKPVSLVDALVKAFPKQPREAFETFIAKGSILVNGRPTNPTVQVTKEDRVLIVFGGEKACYASRNRAEYWAEGFQCWYDTNRTMDHDHNHIETREQLEAYDVELAKLCAETLGRSEWRFVSPRKRAGKGHLAGYDPSKAPVVVDKPHIKKAANDYYDKYWVDFWQRLHDKHGTSLARRAQRQTKPSSDEDFGIVEIKGWSFHIHEEYLNGDAARIDRALANAERQLEHGEALVPKKADEKLRQIPVWVNPGKRTAEYHWSREWLKNNGRNPDMARAIQISDIRVLSRTSPTGPWVMLHELMHGYHDRFVDAEGKKLISAAYKAALEKGLYQKVLHTKRGRGTYIKAYGATRMEEYFAENCEAYFGLNDFYPFVRAQLKEYDREIFDVIEKLFEIKPSK